MILYLDEIPRTKFQKFTTSLKIFIKEGLIYQNWREVFKDRSKGGSVSIPEIVRNGLAKHKNQFAINKLETKGIDHIHVFKDVNALKWALSVKRSNQNLKVTAGPFIVNLPNEAKHIIEDELLDGYLYFSEWHRNLFHYYSDSIKEKESNIWFCGVDTDYWKPNALINKNEKSEVLVYSKTNPEVSKFIINYLESKKIDYTEIVCGKYKRQEYLDSLQKSKLAIFVSVTETQGLAIFESWSADVPTLHFNPGVWRYQGNTYDKASSCPYLEDRLGVDFKGIEDFEVCLNEAIENVKAFRPRDTVLKKYTTQHSIDLLIKILSN